jgi:hypothetical protein
VEVEMDHVRLKDVKCGDVVWECEYGNNIKMTIKEGAIDTGDGIKAIGVTSSGVEIPLYHSHDYEHYGPKLYSSPQYCYMKDGECIFHDSGETY